MSVVGKGVRCSGLGGKRGTCVYLDTDPEYCECCEARLYLRLGFTIEEVLDVCLSLDSQDILRIQSNVIKEENI